MFKAKYGWDKDDTLLMNTIITTAGVIGLTIGSFATGPILKYGRRKAALITHFTAILGALICMFESWVGSLIIGRTLLGVAAGFYNVVFGKFLTENIPPKYISKFAMSHNAIICIGFVVTFLMGSFLPDSDNI